MAKPSIVYEALQSRQALSTEVADQLCARIRRERLVPDTVLGTEAEIAEQFGVSRTVVREAVGQLRGLGMVKSRQGLGLCVVNGNTIDTMAKALTPMFGDKASWGDLCQLRFVLEVGSLPLAVERATEEQIQNLRRLAEKMRAMLKLGQPISRKIEEEIAQCEVEFHQLIFDAAGSEFTSHFHAVLIEYFRESSGEGEHSSLPTAKDMEDHIKLVDAVTERNVCKGVAILVDHIRHILSS